MKAKLFLLEVVRFREIHVLENLCGYKANPIEQTDAFSVRRRAICGCFQSLCNTILLLLAVALYQHMNFSRHDELCLTVWTSHQIGGQFGQRPSTKIYRKKSPDLLDYSDNLPIQVSFENFKLNKSKLRRANMCCWLHSHIEIKSIHLHFSWELIANLSKTYTYTSSDFRHL